MTSIAFEHKNPVKKLIYPLLGNLLPLQWITKYRFYGGKHFFKWRPVVERSQWHRSDDIRRYQEKHLAQIITHCYDHVPYYRKIYKDLGIQSEAIQSTKDLSRLPLLDKDTILKHADQLTADNAASYNPEMRKTGGSTTKMLKFYHDKSVRGLMSALTRRWERWAGQKTTDRYIMMRSAIGFREGRLDMDTPYNYDPFARMLEINTADLSAETIKKDLLLIKEFNASYLHSYPSISFGLAKFILKHPEYRVPLKGVLLSSELLYPEMKQVIEQAFNCSVYDFYGQEEAVGWAMSCTYGNLHVCHEIGVFEIIKDGKSCGTNEIGQFVCTGLHNYSMPLVRYAIGDYGCFKDIECSCGRKSRIIEIFGGKEKDLLVTRAGMVRMFPSANLFSCLNGIQDYQIIQETMDDISIKIVKETDSKPGDVEQFRQKVQQYLGEDMRINIEFVDAITRTSANKFKMVISKVPLPFD